MLTESPFKRALKSMKKAVRNIAKAALPGKGTKSKGRLTSHVQGTINCFDRTSIAILEANDPAADQAAKPPTVPPHRMQHIAEGM